MDVKQERMSDGEEEGDYLFAMEISCGESNVKLEDHNKEGSSDITCRICDRIFPNYAQLKTHQTLKHFSKGQQRSSYDSDLEQANVGPFKCEVCMKAFPTRVQHVNHMEVHNKPYSCGICSKQMSSDLKCVEHMVFHFIEGLYDCDTCEKQFVNLKHHIFLHLLGEAYQCAICKKTFKQRTELDVHVKEFHSFKCSVCNVEFVHIDDLRDHMETHNCVKPIDYEMHSKTPEHEASLQDEKMYNLKFVDNTMKYNMKRSNSEDLSDCDLRTRKRLMKKLASKVRRRKESERSKSKKSRDYDEDDDPLGSAQLAGRGKRDAGDRPFKCETCGKTYPTNGNLRRHRRIHAGIRPYKCSLCGKDFSDPSNWRTHLNSHIKEEVLEKNIECDVTGKCMKKESLVETQNLAEQIDFRLFKCRTCGKILCSKGNLRRHEQIHTGERPYKCDICGKTFCDPSNWKSHLAKYPGEHTINECEKVERKEPRPKATQRPRKEKLFKRFECDICCERFKNKRVLADHIRNHAGDDGLRTHECEICKKRFASTKKLASHLLTHSGDAKPYKCEVCQEEFIMSVYMQGHVDKTHNAAAGEIVKVKTIKGNKRVQCVLCNNKFGNYTSYVLHIRTHSGEKPFVCEVCGNSYGSRSNLASHLRIHTGERPYKCSDCDRDFSNLTSCLRHKKQHTGERPFQCQICHKQFIQRIQLTGHMMQHTGERPYKCSNSMCDKSYTKKHELKKHERSHIIEKPYGCEVCGNEYREKKHLMRHMRNVHGLGAVLK